VSDPKTMINEVQVFNSKCGLTLRIYPHRYMPQNVVGTAAVVFGLDLTRAKWQIHELIPMTVEEIAYTGAGPAAQIMWQGCVMCGVEKANFAFVG